MEVKHESESWAPIEGLLRPLMEMGINENAAIRGLYYTGNTSVDAAASWVFDNNTDPTVNLPIEGFGVAQHSHKETLGDDTYKMVFVVNVELPMGIGKIAAQVAHACHALHKILLGNSASQLGMKDWEETGTTKIVLKGNNIAHLMELEELCKAQKIPNYLVIDAGRTQIAPSSGTVLGLFGRSSSVDKITGSLQLLP